MAELVHDPSMHRATADETKEKATEKCRQVLRELKSLTTDNASQTKKVVRELLAEVVGHLGDLADQVGGLEDEYESAQETIGDHEANLADIQRVVQMVYDVDRGMRDPEEVFHYIKERWE